MVSSDPEAQQHLDDILASGRGILVLDDLLLSSAHGEVLLSQYIRRRLGEIAEIDLEEAADLDLSELTLLARQASSSRTQKFGLELNALRPYAEDFIIRLMAAPWQRVYDTIGISTALRPQYAPRPVDGVELTALDRRVTQCVHLRGLDGQLHFSSASDDHAASTEIWARQIAADSVSYPLVIISTKFTRQLKQLLSARQRIGGSPLPAALLFVPGTVNEPLRRAAGLYNVTAVAVDLDALYGKALPRQRKDVIKEGRRDLARTRELYNSDGTNILVDRLVDDSTDVASWRFLEGYRPTWADVAQDRPVRLSRLSNLHAKSVMASGARNIVTLRGRAGSGKTSLLMRFALEMRGKGRTVVWIDRSVETSLATLETRVDQLDPDLVLVDDLDSFGNRAVALLRAFNRNGRSAVVASVRRTNSWALEGTQFTSIDGDSDLSNNDLEALASALASAGRLGSLEGVPTGNRTSVLGEMCKRDLLSALIEVVSGKPFAEYITSEVEQLQGPERSAYSVICLAEHLYENQGLLIDDLLQVAGAQVTDYATYRDSVETLINERALVITTPRGLTSRHRVIADAVVNALPPVEIGRYLGAMLRIYAGRAVNITDSNHPDRRLMIQLLNHTRMRRLRIDPPLVREAYASVQDILRRDYHYWLQRGAFETEHHDLDTAETYLKSSRSLPGGTTDYLVSTEWGLLRLRRAIREPNDATESDLAVEAFRELLSVAKTQGVRSPHTFVIALKYGSRWIAQSASLRADQQSAVVDMLHEFRRIADLLLLGNADVQAALKESQRLVTTGEGTVAAAPRFPMPRK